MSYEKKNTASTNVFIDLILNSFFPFIIYFVKQGPVYVYSLSYALDVMIQVLLRHHRVN